MSASQARQIAFRVLRRVEIGDTYAKDLLQAELGEKARPEDATLATETTLGTLRWHRRLNFLLERHCRRPRALLNAEVRISL